MAARSEGGVLTVTRDDGKVNTYRTETCFHCQKIIIMAKGHDQGGWCGMCMKNICGPCCDNGRCTPFEAKLEAAERKDAARRALSLALGI